MQSSPLPNGLELYNLDDVTKVFDVPMVELLMSGMSIEDAQKTVNADGRYNDDSSTNEEVAVEGEFVPFK